MSPVTDTLLNIIWLDYYYSCADEKAGFFIYLFWFFLLWLLEVEHSELSRINPLIIFSVVCENSENIEKRHCNNPELELTPSLSLFNSVNNKNHKNHQKLSEMIELSTRKNCIFSHFAKVEPEHVSALRMTVIKIVAKKCHFQLTNQLIN